MAKTLSLPKLQISKSTTAAYSICMFIGLLTFVIGLIVDKERIWHSYLTSFFYFASLALEESSSRHFNT